MASGPGERYKVQWYDWMECFLHCSKMFWALLGLLHDVPNPEVHLAFSQNADDIAMVRIQHQKLFPQSHLKLF